MLSKDELTEQTEYISKVGDFLRTYYEAELLEALRKGKRHLVVDFSKLIKYDSYLGDYLLNKPDDFAKIVDVVIQEFKKVPYFHLRFSLPDDTLNHQ